MIETITKTQHGPQMALALAEAAGITGHGVPGDFRATRTFTHGGVDYAMGVNDLGQWSYTGATSCTPGSLSIDGDPIGPPVDPPPPPAEPGIVTLFKRRADILLTSDAPVFLRKFKIPEGTWSSITARVEMTVGDWSPAANGKPKSISHCFTVQRGKRWQNVFLYSNIQRIGEVGRPRILAKLNDDQTNEDGRQGIEVGDELVVTGGHHFGGEVFTLAENEDTGLRATGHSPWPGPLVVPAGGLRLYLRIGHSTEDEGPEALTLVSDGWRYGNVLITAKRAGSEA